jgi:hypothetical protein
MHILDHQSFIETRLQSDEWYGGDIRALNDTPVDKTLSGKKGTLKDNFEKYAVTYPDGRVITLHQDGTITEKPIDGQEHAVRPPDRISKNLIS